MMQSQLYGELKNIPVKGTRKSFPDRKYERPRDHPKYLFTHILSWDLNINLYIEYRERWYLFCHL